MGGVLYNQPTDYNSVYASQNDATAGGYGLFAQMFDNFTLGLMGAGLAAFGLAKFRRNRA